MERQLILVDSPLGPLRVVAAGGALVAVHMEEGPPARPALREPGAAVDPLLARAAAQLVAWLGGERLDFDLPLRPAGTPFQLAVWSALREIPFGETRTYGQIAARIGRPVAARAVGAANARNPLAIVVPCHRVVGADGTLTGYAGGLERKRWLLEHERRLAAR